MTTRILLADDHAIVRRELRRLIESEDGWAVCAEAANGVEAVLLAVTSRPHVIALDINMPIMGGIEAARRIREVAPAVAIVVVSMDDSEPMVEAAIAAGARGYIVKSDASQRLVPAIRALLADATYLPTRSTLSR